MLLSALRLQVRRNFQKLIGINRTIDIRQPLAAAVQTIQEDKPYRGIHTSSQTMATHKDPEFSDARISDDEIKFLQDVHDMVVNEELVKGSSRKSKVIEFQHPKELWETLEMDVGAEGSSHGAVLESLKNVFKYSVHTGNPHFYNQLYGAVDTYGLAGAWVTESLNTNAHTFEAAPVFILMERYMIQKLNQYVGYQADQLDGVFAPGGSLATIYSINLARYKLCPEYKTKGLYGSERLTMFTSQESHYSIQKGAAFLGFGMDSVYVVKTNELGQMEPDDLRKKIQESKDKGEKPFYVNATAGSTVLGAFDQLEVVSDIAKEHGMWLHVDAAWGGGVLVSSKHRHLMKGIERSDSVQWNPHKLLGAPIQCSILLVQHKNLLAPCFSAGATYLFQQDKFYDRSYDTGDKTVQCGRKGEGLKLWLMWKAHGDDGIARIPEYAMEKSGVFTQKIRAREGFKLVLPEFEYTNISFWYIPKRLRNQPETPEWWQEVHKVAPLIKERMVKNGSMMIGYQPLAYRDLVNFFRIIIRSPATTDQDLEDVLDEIEELGKDL